jgi:1-aminocyclopropane-1-carboxylate deaminase
LSAIATILAFAWLKKETLLHVLLLADDEQQFLSKLKHFHLTFEVFIEHRLSWSDVVHRFKIHTPTQARAFGSVNATILRHIKFLAREEGFFTDPIYSAKLFLEARNTIHEQALEGNILMIHSGGALTLMGFQKQLSDAIQA